MQIEILINVYIQMSIFVMFFNLTCTSICLSYIMICKFFSNLFCYFFFSNIYTQGFCTYFVIQRSYFKLLSISYQAFVTGSLQNVAAQWADFPGGFSLICFICKYFTASNINVYTKGAFWNFTLKCLKCLEYAI